MPTTDIILLGLGVIASLMVVTGLLIQHSLAQARQGLALLIVKLQLFQHELADLNVRLAQLERMARRPASERQVN